MLALVDAERLEPHVQVVRHGAGAFILVVEREHPDAPGLAIAAQGEERPFGRFRSAAQGFEDAAELVRRPVAEERERGVQVFPGNDARFRHVSEFAELPIHDPLEDLVREPQSEEEA
jgi:hypothetical protein